MSTAFTEEEVDLASKKLAHAFWQVVNQSLPSLAWRQVTPALLESVVDAQKMLILRLADQPTITAADEAAIDRIWAICPRDAPHEDAMSHGPTPDRQSMIDVMEDGDVLIGFNARVANDPPIRFVMVSGALVPKDQNVPPTQLSAVLTGPPIAVMVTPASNAVRPVPARRRHHV